MNDVSASAPDTPARVTDSPWFWVMLFSCVSLVGMQLLDWKYNQVQARLERQFQGREWARQHGAQVQMNPASERGTPVPVVASENAEQTEPTSVADGMATKANQSEHSSNVPNYSRPGALVISLWPLRLLALGALAAASIQLWRKSRTRVLSQEKRPT